MSLPASALRVYWQLPVRRRPMATRRGSDGGEMGWSALVALPDFGSRVLSASATRRVRPRRANVARRPLLGARQRLDAAQ